MSNTFSQPSKAVQRAARWLTETPWEQTPRPLVPHLRKEFGLSALESTEAIREARLIQARAH